MNERKNCCEDFSKALEGGFIVQQDDKLRLADRMLSAMDGSNPSSAAISSVLYGPEIDHCPFCGSPLSAK